MNLTKMNFITEMNSDVEEIKYIQIYKRVRRVKFFGYFIFEEVIEKQYFFLYCRNQKIHS